MARGRKAVPTNKTDFCFALFQLGRSKKYGPRTFSNATLYRRFLSVKQQRGGTVSKLTQTLYETVREQFINKKWMIRHSDGQLSLSPVGRLKCKIVLRRVAELPREERMNAAMQVVKKELGPARGRTKGQILEYANELEAKLEAPPSALLQSWSSLSLIGGSFNFGADYNMEESQQEDTEPVAGPSVSPVRVTGPAPANPEASYPTPESAPRAAGFATSMMPHTPCPTNASMTSSRVVSFMLRPTEVNDEPAPEFSGRIDWHQDMDGEPASEDHLRNSKGKGVMRLDGHMNADGIAQEYAELRKRIDKLSAEVERLRNENNTDRRASEQRIAALQAELNQSLDKIAQLQKDYQATCAQRDEFERQYNEVSEQLNQSRADVEKVGMQCNRACERDKARNTQWLTMLQNHNAELEVKCNALRAKLKRYAVLAEAMGREAEECAPLLI